jgi:hypothetical protein
VPWARPSAHGTAHGPFCRAVPPMGHGHFGRAVPVHGPSGKTTLNDSQKIAKCSKSISQFTISHHINQKLKRNSRSQDYMKMIIKKSYYAMLPH